MKFPSNYPKHYSRAQFHDRITHGNNRYTFSAFTSKNQPRKHGDVVITLDPQSAIHASTWWRNDRTLKRKSVNNDIENGPYEAAEKSDDYRHFSWIPNREWKFD